MAEHDQNEVPSIDDLLNLVKSTHKDVGSEAAQEAFRRDLEEWLNDYESEDLNEDDEG